jgi:hypothetical protein
MYLLTRLMHSSGQYIQAVYPITAGDNRGVSSAQAVGSALTYARRYSLTALVGVVSEDDDDGNSAADPQQRRQPVQRQQPQPKPQPQPANGQPVRRGVIDLTDANKQMEMPPGAETWIDWRGAVDAKAWAMTQGKFNGQQHMERGYEKVKADCQPANAQAMWICWYEYVMAHEPAKAAKANYDAAGAEDADGWQDVDENGVDVPLFA